VGLTIGSEDRVAHGDPVFAGRTRVGVVTSATQSPFLRAQIALARVDIGSAALGQALSIGKLDGRQKRLPAVVVPFPHYDPQKLKVRS
jgi:aminomethyltransferase